MIMRKTKRTYYETELIDKIICDRCDKDLTNIDDDIFIIQADYAYFNTEKSRLESLENGYIRHYCSNCATIIQEPLLFKE